MNFGINLEPIDDKVMAVIVDFKTMNSYYPTVLDIEILGQIDRLTLNMSLNRLKELNKVQLIHGFDRKNPYVKG